MCTPALAIAAVSAVATVGGAVMSASNQASVANAQMQAAQQTQEAQNQGFMQRMQAQSDQNQRDYATQQAAIQANAAGETQMEQQQQQAWANREQQIQAANNQTQAIGAAAQKAAADTQAQVTPEKLAQAQAAQKQQIEALAQPGINNISTGTTQTPSGPVAQSPSTNNETASAIATRLAQAATATRDYVANRAQVASYGAPIATMANATQNLNAETAPLAFNQATAEQIQPLLQPSTVQYGAAGNYYQNLLKAISARTQGRINVSQAIASGNITNADLVQADQTTQAQNQAAYAAWKAASDPVPGILSAVGQAGLYGAGYLGAGSSLGDIFSGSKGNAAITAAQTVAPSLLTSIRNWANTPFRIS
jgi:hypothetical protein